MIQPSLAHFGFPALGLYLAVLATSSRAADVPEPRAFADLEGVTHAEFNRDGTRVLIRTRKLDIGLWDAASGQPVAGELKTGTSAAAHLVSPEGRAVLIGFTDGHSRVFDTSSGNALSPPLEAAFQEGESQRAAFSPDGKRVVIVEPEFASVFQVSTGTREAKIPSRTSPGAEEPDMNATAAFTADGSRCHFLVGDKVTAYDTWTWKPLGKPLKHPSAPSAYYIGFAISTDGRWLVTFDSPGENGPKAHLQVWDAVKGKALGKPFVAVNGLEGRFVAGGRLLITPGRGEASVRELPSLKTLATIKKHDEIEGPKVAASPDGKWLLSWGSDRELHLIDLTTGKVVDRFSSSAAISQVLLLPDSTGALVVFDNSTFITQDYHDHYVMRFAFPELRATHSLRIVKYLRNATLAPDGRSLSLIVGKTDHELLWLYDAANLQAKLPSKGQ